MNKKILNITMICLLLFLIFFMVTSSKEVIESVAFSISIWKDNLFPTLFPFFVVSNLLMNYGFIDMIGKGFNPVMRRLFHLPGECGFILAASLFSGFPSGAKYTSDLVTNKRITKQQGERLLTFTHYSNPLFVLGMIGSVLLNNSDLALIILISHITAGILTGIIMNHSYPIPTLETRNTHFQKNSSTKTFGELLKTSIFDSLNTMFLLLGVVTIFLIITTCIHELFHFPDIIQAILSGILEMTQGVKMVSALRIPDVIKASLLVGIISFGGFSVHLQVISIISSSNLKYKPFFCARVMHSFLAMGFVFLFYVLFV